MGSEFADLMKRVCAGSEEAARELVKDYGPHLRRAARSRLSPPLRPLFDSEDLQQMVWVVITNNPALLTRCQNPRQLIRLLVAVSRNKILHEFRHANAKKSGPLDVRLSVQEITGTPEEPWDKQPNPAECAAAHDALGVLTQRLSRQERRILKLVSAGASPREAADECGVNVRTVQRLVCSVRRGLMKEK